MYNIVENIKNKNIFNESIYFRWNMKSLNDL